MELRKSVFSGSWYPGGAKDCEKQIKEFLSEGSLNVPTDIEYKVGIVPHAGWYFSGSLACNVINMLKNGDKPDTVIIFGMHLAPNSDPYIMAEGAWETPFGPIEVDVETGNEIKKHESFVHETPSRYVKDNTIELQMPFVKYFFPDARVLTMGVPPSDVGMRIGAKIVEITQEKGTSIKVIGSTDLTHYGPNYGFTPKGTGQEAVEWVKNTNDKNVVDLMLSMETTRVISEGLQNSSACCAGAAAASIEAAKLLGAKAGHLTGYSTSNDKSPGSSFVGYAGILFS